MISKVLVQRADRLGDVIFSLPVIEHLHRAYPEAQIHFLTSSLGAQLVEGHPLITKVIVFDELSASSSEYRKLVRLLRVEEYDTYLCLWNRPRLAKLGKTLKIPTRIGDGSQWLLRRCFTKFVRLNPRDLTQHQVDFNLKHLEPLGIYVPLDGIVRRLYPDLLSEDKVNAWFRRFLSPDLKTVAICCSTGGSSYSLSEDVILEFLDRLRQDHRFNIVLCGQVAEDSMLRTYSKPDVLNLIGKTSVKDLVSVIRLSDYYLGGDTGPSHLASFLDKPMVFYSPLKTQHPTRWGPLCPYFRVIRDDYLYAPLRFERPDELYRRQLVDGVLVYHRFCELLNMVDLNDAMDDGEVRRQLALETFRVLYLFKEYKFFREGAAALEQFKDRGLKVFPFWVQQSFFAAIVHIVRAIRFRNVTIIQGQGVPRLLLALIRFVVGTVYQYWPPVYVNQRFHDYIELDDYLVMYEKAFSETA